MPDVDPDLRQKLPPGRHGLPKDFVEESQRTRLIEAGIKVFAAKGDGTRIVDITSGAGTSRRSFYEFFENMDAFRPVVLDQVLNDFIVWMETVVVEERRIPGFVEGLLAYAKNQPDHFQVVLYGKPRRFEGYDAMVRRLAELTGLREIVTGGILWTLQTRIASSRTLTPDSLTKTATLLDTDDA